MPALVQPVRRVGPGIGRDFVVGDIHGTVDLLVKALAAVSFNPTLDRLFFGSPLPRVPDIFSLASRQAEKLK